MKKGLSIILPLAMLMLTLPVSAVASELQEAEITNGAEPPEIIILLRLKIMAKYGLGETTLMVN